MPLPPLEGQPPRLPDQPDPWPSTMKELEERFVTNAPTDQRPRREFMWNLLESHAKLVANAFEEDTVRMWIDGGFITHKNWAKPKDIDVVYFVPPHNFDIIKRPRLIPLWTLTDVTFKIGTSEDVKKAAVLKPGFGFIDAYAAPDTPSTREIWKTKWSSLKNPAGEIVEGQSKGFVEVTLNEKINT